RRALTYLSTLGAFIALVLFMVASFSMLNLRLWRGSPLPQFSVSFEDHSVGISYYSRTALPPSTPRTLWHAYGFSSQTVYALMSYSRYPAAVGTAPFRLRQVYAPAWVLLVLFLTLIAYPAVVFNRGPLRRYRRHKHGA